MIEGHYCLAISSLLQILLIEHSRMHACPNLTCKEFIFWNACVRLPVVGNTIILST